MGAQCDLLKKSLQNKLHKLLAGGVFVHFSAAPVCASFSRAITPAVRNHDYPLGVPWAFDGNARKTEGRERSPPVCLLDGVDMHIHGDPLLV